MQVTPTERRSKRTLAAVEKAAKRLAAARAQLDAAYLEAHLNGWSYDALASVSVEPRSVIYRRMNAGGAARLARERDQRIAL